MHWSYCSLALSHCFILTLIPWWQYCHSISVYMIASNINNKKYRNDHMLHLLICVLLVLYYHIDGLVQERHNSCALAMVWWLSCTNPLIWAIPSIYSIRNLNVRSVTGLLPDDIMLLLKSILTLCQKHPRGRIAVKLLSNYIMFLTTKWNLKTAWI